MKKAVYFCSQNSMDCVFGPEERAAVAERFDISPVLITRENWRDHRDLLWDVEVIVSSWEGAVLDDELLAAMPKLSMYFYGAGTINGLMTPAAWERGIRITTAVAANAIPVAEFCLSQILFSLKRGWKYMKLTESGIWPMHRPLQGNYGSKVGIVSLGQISRKLCELLKAFDLNVYVYSQHLTPEDAAELGVRIATMEEIFQSCDVVSIHLPSNERTRHMIGRQLLDRMKPDSTLINTARGAVINQPELIEFLQDRPDVTACLDVTEPEPPEAGCPLFYLSNAILTPHLAGSRGGEPRRMARYIIEEMDRWLSGEPLQWEVSCEMAAKIA